MADEQETRDRILNAAREAFVERGTAGARVQEIADRAGVNKALVHYYFSTKERLAEAVFQREAGRLLPPVLQTLASELPLEEKVRRVMGIYMEILAQAPALPAYILSELHHHPDRLESFLATVTGAAPRSLAAPIRTVLARQIDAEVEAGRMGPMAPEQFFVNLVSLCIFPFAARPMLEWVLQGREGGFDGFIRERRETLPDFFLKGLRP